MGNSSSAYEALVALVEEVAAMAEATREFAAGEGEELMLLERVRERSNAVAAVVERVEEAAMAVAEDPPAPLPKAEEATIEVEEPSAAVEQGPRAEIVESLDDLFGDL